MAGRLHDRIGIKIACIFFLAFSLPIIGCSGNGSGVEGTANAQVPNPRLIQTFVLIDTTSFVLTTDDEPTIEIIDGATKYSLNSDGTVSFTTTTGAEIIPLVINDIVIERPDFLRVTVDTPRP
jgi:hypothetical protein